MLPVDVEALEPLVDAPDVFEDESVDVGAADMPPRMPETMVELFDGTDEVLEADGDAEVGAEAPKENVGAEAVVPEEVLEGLAAGGAADLAAPKPEKPPNGLAFAGGCEAVFVLEAVVAPKLNVGVDVAGAVDGEEVETPPNWVFPPRLAKGLEPPGTLNGEDDAAAGAPKGAGLAADDPDVPGNPFRLGRPRMTLPAVGVAGIDPCEDGESSSDPSSPSSLRICFSACRFILTIQLWLLLCCEEAVSRPEGDGNAVQSV